MKRVGLKLLKNNLSKYVRKAAAGETIEVTDRGTVVAELSPPRGKRALHPSPVIAQGIREGWITPARNKTGKPPPRRKPLMSFDQLMRDLDRDREDR